MNYLAQTGILLMQLIDRELIIPQVELMAAALNAITGYTVENALQDRQKKSLMLTDSQVALYWVCSK